MNRNSSFTKESDKPEKIDVSNETTANPVSATDGDFTVLINLPMAY
jgi:hypothetical protein